MGLGLRATDKVEMSDSSERRKNTLFVLVFLLHLLSIRKNKKNTSIIH